LSLFTLVTRPMYETKYLNSVQTFVLLGVRGELIFADRSQRGFVKLDRSHLPHEEIVERIERVSPGPYLELFGNHCSGRDEWTCCGGP
jgi:hypothetical protein